ncbi:hypothetical protein LCGC14_1439430 [marine sediment metagenome]|uniref:Uncharacterized protein n=1 Tax=marine sediment metagenome TaxID=412755 RepID=A0A0F9JL36_9ZZZZ
MTTFGGVRGLAQVFIRSAVSRGLSSAATIRTLTTEGLTYRRTEMLADFREWAQVPAKADRIKAVRHDYRPSRDLFIETTGKQLRPFRYQIGVDVYNPETKERFHFVTNVGSERQLTIGEILDEALEPIKRSTEAYKSEITGYHVEAGFHQEGMEWG